MDVTEREHLADALARVDFGSRALPRCKARHPTETCDIEAPQHTACALVKEFKRTLSGVVRLTEPVEDLIEIAFCRLVIQYISGRSHGASGR